MAGRRRGLVAAAASCKLAIQPGGHALLHVFTTLSMPGSEPRCYQAVTHTPSAAAGHKLHSPQKCRSAAWATLHVCHWQCLPDCFFGWQVDFLRQGLVSSDVPSDMRACRCQAVTAGGFSTEVPASPLTPHPDSPQIFCRVLTPEPTSGQVLLELWPCLLLYNALPLPLEWQLRRADHELGVCTDRKTPCAMCQVGQLGIPP